MLRALFFASLAVLALTAIPSGARAQGADWTPPTSKMPQMPAPAELGGGWRSSLGAWFRGVEATSGVKLGEVRAEGDAQSVYFSGEALPVAVWSDRNGDGRADLVEIYRRGAPLAQVIDADYDGTANVIRRYDASGTLIREEKVGS